MSKLLRTTVLILALTLGWMVPAGAVPIVYEFWGTVSGQIGSTTFANRGIHFQLYSDTDSAQTFTNASTNGYTNFVRPGSLSGSAVTIDGIGKANLQLFMLVIANPNDYCRCVGISPTSGSGGDLFDVFHTPYNLANPYDLKGSTPLVTGTVVVFPAYVTVNTSLGALRLDSGYGGSFKATVLPLPPAAGLLGAGLLMLAGLRRRGGSRTGQSPV